MKRIKLFLLSAAIVAAGSAFITRPPVADEYVKDEGNWVLKSSVDGITGNCVQMPNAHCTFILKAGATQPYQDNDFSPADQDRVWQNF